MTADNNASQPPAIAKVLIAIALLSAAGAGGFVAYRLSATHSSHPDPGSVPGHGALKAVRGGIGRVRASECKENP